jgi:hypothetical protein
VLNIKYFPVFCVLWEDLFTQNTGKHLCWTLWEDLFTQNTLCWTLGRFIYTNYWEIHYVEHWENIFTQNTGKYILLNTVGRFIYTKYSEILLCWTLWEDVFTQNTLCRALWEDLFTQNTGKYFMLNTVEYFVSINLPTVFNIMYSPVFCVNKYCHSVQHKVFTSILCR